MIELNEKRLLVTGGAGFIGANFVHYWLSRHPGGRLVVLDALTYAGNRASLDAAEDRPEFRFVQGDIRDQALVEKLLREEGIDTLVHFAAESHVDRSITGPDAFVDTNVVGTHSLLKAARAVWLPDNEAPLPQHRFHHVSTDEVYGTLGANDPAFTETTPYAPNSPYSASKAASDHLVRAYHHTYGLDTTISNCSNNYGPYQFPEKLIPLCILNLLEGKPLPIYGDGKNIRDWLHVEDHCRGIELILAGGRAGETYNIGGNSERSNLEVVEALCTLMDELRPTAAPHARQITFVKDRPGHDRRYAIDARKLEGELGYAPTRSFEAGLRETVDWYLASASWWQPILSGEYREWVGRQYGGSN
ncbi:dTDP-glucose 4,6-dehydratase [Acidihalobacter yilgarnensis]|uniref:dTDP-glucose 4,6-dehydratase n=1 Tax=Acidihalobacter yilgarnensis TaxID=2819280 RepID=A0A1D8IQC5_9GAMM|nr:dTDP-glucose 4,6-dehydratase [Acidihalobacter yilgarnensis]AOU98657.1 dTDP-glucose 4,6-dehydratase [Acidihalobacter yilgarnensis]